MRLERGFVETSLSTSPPASYTLLPGGTSPGDSTQSPVKCQVLVRILIALAIDSMAQPSGRICGAPSRYRIYLCSSPIICVADALSILTGLLTSWYFLGKYPEAARLVVLHRADYRCEDAESDSKAPEQHTWPRLLVFILGVLPAAVKLCSLTGVPWTKAWGLMFVASFLSIEILNLLFHAIHHEDTVNWPSNHICYEYLDPRTFRQRVVKLPMTYYNIVHISRIHSLLDLESPNELNDPRYLYHSDKLLQLNRAKDALDHTSTIFLVSSLLAHMALLAWALNPVFATAMAVYDLRSIPHTNSHRWNLCFEILAQSLWGIDILLSLSFIPLVTMFSFLFFHNLESPNLNKYILRMLKLMFVAKLLPRSRLGMGLHGHRITLSAWNFVGGLSVVTYKGMVWVGRRYPRFHRLVGIENDDEKEWMPGLYLALWFFCGNLGLCVAWYATQYDGVGTVNPSWTSFLGK